MILTKPLLTALTRKLIIITGFLLGFFGVIWSQAQQDKQVLEQMDEI